MLLIEELVKAVKCLYSVFCALTSSFRKEIVLIVT